MSESGKYSLSITFNDVYIFEVGEIVSIITAQVQKPFSLYMNEPWDLSDDEPTINLEDIKVAGVYEGVVPPEKGELRIDDVRNSDV